MESEAVPQTVESLQAALTLEPFNIKLLFKLATVQASSNNYEVAIRYLTRILCFSKGTGPVYTVLGHCYLMMNKDELSVHAYEQATNYPAQKNDPQLFYGLGTLYQRHKNFKSASAAYQIIVDKKLPFNRMFDVYFNLGKCKEANKHYKPAISAYKEAITRTKSSHKRAYILACVARCYWKAGKNKECDQAISEAETLEPLSFKIKEMHSWCCYQQKRFERALDLAMKALEMHQTEDEERVDLQFLVGLCLWKVGNLNQAYTHILSCVSKQPESPSVWCALGVLYALKNQYRDARICFLHSLHLNQKLPETLRNMALIYNLFNEQEVVNLILAKAMELQPLDDSQIVPEFKVPDFEVSDEVFLPMKKTVSISKSKTENSVKDLDLGLLVELPENGRNEPKNLEAPVTILVGENANKDLNQPMCPRKNDSESPAPSPMKRACVEERMASVSLEAGTSPEVQEADFTPSQEPQLPPISKSRKRMRRNLPALRVVDEELEKLVNSSS